MQFGCKIAKPFVRVTLRQMQCLPKKKENKKSDQTAQLAETGCRLADRQL